MARDTRFEQWLTSEGAPWTYAEALSLASFDEKRSLSNQARLTEKLNEDVVAEYARAMREKAEFPAVIAHEHNGQMVVIDGNHRLAAAKKAGRQAFDAYVVTSRDRSVLDRLTRAANMIEGRRHSREAALAHAVYFVRALGMSRKEAANAMQLPSAAVEMEVARQEVRDRATRLGVDDPRMKDTVRLMLNQIELDPVFTEAMRFASATRIVTKEAKEMVAEVKKSTDESGQLGAVRAIASRPEWVERRAMTRNGKSSVPTATITFFRCLNSLSNLLDKHTQPMALGLTNPEVTMRARQAIIAAQVRLAQLTASLAAGGDANTTAHAS